MKKGLWIFVGMLLLAGYGGTKHIVDSRMTARKSADDLRFFPSPTTMKTLSFGYESAMADISWIEALNYFGAELGNPKRTHRYLPNYCDLVLTLDPLFRVFYEWAGTAFIYNGLVIDRQAIIRSTEYVNQGIIKFHEHFRYDPQMILKGAFNYALEAHNHLASVPYYEMAARIFPEKRDMLLVASTWASSDRRLDVSSRLKLEFLSSVAFEAQTREELLYAVRVLSSANFDNQSAAMIRSMRIKMEKDEDIQKIVETRLNDQPFFRNQNIQSVAVVGDRRLENVLNVDFSRTWMPAEMLVLFSL